MSAVASPSAFLIAAPSSGSGKTTVTLGLLRALRRRHLSVKPFKCGPDYIDTRFHQVAAGSGSINLDLFMSSSQAVGRLFRERSAGVDVSVVEGAMGLFDGYDCSRGSAAEIAAVIGVPVILVVDAAHTAYSVSIALAGVRSLLESARLAGVIFNRVGSENHEEILRKAAENCGVTVLGAIPRCNDLFVPGRHLGLSLDYLDSVDRIADLAADLIEKHVDISQLLALTHSSPSRFSAPDKPSRSDRPGRPLRIALASDEAFCFTYAENLRSYEIIPFSPLRDSSLPTDVDLLYLPGGYPELYRQQLSANVAMLDSVRNFARAGGRILGECGGLLYLSADIDGIPMTGLLPFSATMQNPRLHLGYRRVLLPDGSEICGHEFHYSRLLDPDLLPDISIQFNAAGKRVSTPLYRLDNIIAGYTHLYWADSDILNIFNR